MEFDEAFVLLLGHEGGFVDHEDDPGGATRWGITERVARANGYTGHMSVFPQSLAKPIYRKQYWDAVRADELPPAVRFDVFDAAVNSGAVQAAKWLQRAVGVTADGVIGAQTIAKVRGMNGAALAAAFNGERLEFMAGLTTWPSFGRGWARRVASNLKRQGLM